MNLLEKTLLAHLAGFTTNKNEKEIWTTGEDGYAITVEPIDINNYIVRKYWDNGQIRAEKHINNEQINTSMWYENGIMPNHEKANCLCCKVWLDNGQLWRENNYKLGSMDGIQREWDEKGELVKCEKYKWGELVVDQQTQKKQWWKFWR